MLNNLQSIKQDGKNYSLFAQNDLTQTLDDHAFMALMDEPVTYVREFSLITGSINAGFLLSYLLKDTVPDEWFKINADQIREKIGMTSSELRLAREKLLQLDILQNKRVIKPHSQSFYYINDKAVDGLTKSYHGVLSPLNLASVPLSLNRLQLLALAGKRGSIKSALALAAIQELLSNELLYERKEYSRWIAVTDNHLMQRTALKRTELCKAITFLIDYNIIDLKKEGFPATKRYRVSYLKLGYLTALYLKQKNK